MFWTLFFFSLSFVTFSFHFILALRPQYFKIIEECVSQIVLHRSGTDPDFSYRKRLDVDFSHLLGKCHTSVVYLLNIHFNKTCELIFSFSLFVLEVCVDKARIDECEQRASELAQKASIGKQGKKIIELNK